MYEARQNKEKVSRRIDAADGGARQMMKIKNVNSILFRTISFPDNMKERKFIQRVIDVNKYTDGKRPSFPYKDPIYRNLYVLPDNLGNATKHHVIPWGQLKKFVTTLYMHPEYNHFLRNILQGAIGVMYAQSPKIDGIRMQGDSTFVTTMDEILTPVGFKFNSSEQDNIAAAVCWLPGNLFLGPISENRSDDPGEEFEQNAANAVGERFPILQSLNKGITEFIDNPTELKQSVLEDFATVIGWKTPMAFNPDAWEKEGDKWHLK